MNYTILKRSTLAAIFLIALYSSSCRKQDHGVGIGLFSNDNLLGAHFVDTFSIQSYSTIEDTVSSQNRGLVNLGFYNDPFFGKTKAEFYTQFEIGSSGVDFGDTLNCDSIVLYLKLGAGDLSYYGPENKPLKIDVHLISKSADFNKENVYYTSSSLPVNRESLLDPDFDNLIQPNFFDIVYLSRDTAFSVLEIPGVIPLKLSKEFGQQILDLTGTSVLESNDNFLEEYKGLAVSIIGEDGEDILFIDMADFGTALMIYYKEGMEQDNREYKFVIDGVSAHFNTYQHDYEQSGSIELLATMQDPSIGNQYFFTQSGAGFQSYVSFPTLLNMLESQLFIPINKADLILPVRPGSTKEYAPPSQLFIFRINEDGLEEILLDQYSDPLLGVSHIDGMYDSENNQYRFNIIKHIQAVLDGDIEPSELVIKTGSPGSTPNRVILNGNEVDTTFLEPMKLRIYYTSLIR